MNFEVKELESLMRSFKWARNNSLQIFEQAYSSNLLEYRPTNDPKHGLLYQFQCVLTTTDKYYRQLSNHENQQFGVLVHDDSIISKVNIPEADIKFALKRQIVDLESLLKDFDEKEFSANIQTIQSIINHEYLHQGQLIVMFRENQSPLPDRFQRAFDL